jgi:hypothetical protein
VDGQDFKARDPAKTKAKTSQPARAFGVKSWLGFAAGDVLT